VSNGWTSGIHVVDLTGFGYVETTGVAGQFRVVPTTGLNLMYSIQVCENCAAEEGFISTGTYTTIGTAGTYDQVRIFIQYWNGFTPGALFLGSRVGGFWAGFRMGSA
jgi:hypothetical protein